MAEVPPPTEFTNLDQLKTTMGEFKKEFSDSKEVICAGILSHFASAIDFLARRVDELERRENTSSE